MIKETGIQFTFSVQYTVHGVEICHPLPPILKQLTGAQTKRDTDSKLSSSYPPGSETWGYAKILEKKF